MPVTITVQDYGFDRVRRGLEQFSGLAVEAGLFDPEQAVKGVAHEFGTRTIPARPWLSVAADTSGQRYATTMGEAIGAVCDGANPERALQPVAEVGKRSARDVIAEGRVGGPALAPATVAAKGHGRKLIDTGEMLDSIDGRVVQASEVGR